MTGEEMQRLMEKTDILENVKRLKSNNWDYHWVIQELREELTDDKVKFKYRKRLFGDAEILVAKKGYLKIHRFNATQTAGQPPTFQ